MSEDEKLDPWVFDFADRVAIDVLAYASVRRLALKHSEVHTIRDAIREAVLTALHDAPKQEPNQ